MDANAENPRPENLTLTSRRPIGLLDVRMEAGELTKGEKARIIDYDPKCKIHYLVAAADPP